MDYKNGKIYSIRSYLTDKFYIGSTVSPLSKRFGEHKKNYKDFIAGKYSNVTSFEIIKFGDAYIELLEEYPCENKNQLNRREGEFIRKNNCVNKIIDGRTDVEYRNDNKQKIKEYNDTNREHILEYQKEWRVKNKDKINENQKLYYQDNKDKINEKNVCECGGCYSYHHKSTHLKTLKHLNYISNCDIKQSLVIY